VQLAVEVHRAGAHRERSCALLAGAQLSQEVVDHLDREGRACVLSSCAGCRQDELFGLAQYRFHIRCGRRAQLD
jgi:hypothetical protein